MLLFDIVAVLWIQFNSIQLNDDDDDDNKRTSEFTKKKSSLRKISNWNSVNDDISSMLPKNKEYFNFSVRKFEVQMNKYKVGFSRWIQFKRIIFTDQTKKRDKKKIRLYIWRSTSSEHTHTIIPHSTTSTW